MDAERQDRLHGCELHLHGCFRRDAAAGFDPIYTVSFDSDGGTPVESQLVIRGETASNPGEPTRRLYTFEGWYLDGTLYDFSKPVLSNLTLTAKWKLINEPLDPILPALIPATKTPTTGRFPFTDVTTGDWFMTQSRAPGRTV